MELTVEVAARYTEIMQQADRAARTAQGAGTVRQT